MNIIITIYHFFACLGLSVRFICTSWPIISLLGSVLVKLRHPHDKGLYKSGYRQPVCTQIEWTFYEHVLHTHTHMLDHMHVHTGTHARKVTNAPTHSCMHTFMHVHTHTLTHATAHTRTHIKYSAIKSTRVMICDINTQQIYCRSGSI